MKRIVAVGGDAGGAAALAPVLRALRTRNVVDLKILAYREASDLWARAGLPIERLPDFSPGDLAALIGADGAALVLAATSVNGTDHERSVIRWARHAGVPSVSVLDFWSNYAARFRGRPDEVLELPTAIAVMDERARREMIADGFPPGRLVVTGQPAFDDIAAFRSRWTLADRLAMRHELAAAHGTLVVFASQPLSQMATLTGEARSHIDERAVLADVLRSLEEIAEVDGREIVLVVRPHPREHLTADDLPKGDRVRVVHSVAGRPWGVAMAADVVVGMTSVLMLEAALLGCAVISVQPDGARSDPLPIGGGILERVYDRARLTHALRDALALQRDDRVGGLTTPTPEATATERVVELVLTTMAHPGDRDD